MFALDTQMLSRQLQLLAIQPQALNCLYALVVFILSVVVLLWKIEPPGMLKQLSSLIAPRCLPMHQSYQFS